MSTVDVDVNNPNAPTISTNKARQEGFNPVNEREVSMKPNDMRHKGFHPNNPNKPADAR